MSRIVKWLYILTGAAAAIGVVSAIGSTCVSLDPFWQKAVFAIAGEFSEVWLITYFVTWLSALAWGVLFWALMTRKAWFYPVALINSIAGALSRGIPALLMTYGFFQTPRTGIMFTPSWIIAILNVIILIILLIPAVKQGIGGYMEEVGTSSEGSVGKEVAQFAYVLFGIGIVMMVQPFIMPTHIVDGVNIASSWGYLLASGALQFYSGLFSILLGIFMQIVGRLIDVVYSSKPTPLKV